MLRLYEILCNFLSAVSLLVPLKLSERHVILRKLFVRVIDINSRGGGAPE